jgi:hypothetical protein
MHLSSILVGAVLCLVPTIRGVKIGGSPERVDQVNIDRISDALLTELQGITVLDTGLAVHGSVCDVPSAVTKLTAAFGSLKEVRGWLFIEKGSCMSDLSFLSSLAVVRADMVGPNTAGVTLIGFDLLTDLPDSLVVSRCVKVFGSVLEYTFP